MNSNNFKRFATLQDIIQFLTRYVKYWRLSIFGAILGSILALAYFVYGKPSYYSKSLIEYSYLDLPIRSEVSDLTGSSRWDNIIFRINGGLQSSWLAERTALRLGLIKSVGEVDTIWSRYINKVRVRHTVANHFELEVWVFEPKLAKIWPEAMLAEYHDYLTETRIKHRDSVVAGFTKEMDRIKKNLIAESERDRKFESDNHLLENYITNNKLEQLPSEMLTYRARLDAMSDMEEFVKKTAPSVSEKLALLKKYRTMPLPVGTIVRHEKTPDPFIAKNVPSTVVPGQSGEASSQVNSSMGNVSSLGSNTTIVMPELSKKTELWEGIDANLKAAVNEYEQLSSQLLPGHEKMRDLQTKIDQLNFALTKEWEKSFEAFQVEKDHLKSKLLDLQNQMPEYRKLIANYDDYRRDFRLESSGRLAWEQAYTSMKSRLTAMEYTGPEVQVQFDHKGFIELRDQVPVSPNKSKLLNYALALSVGLGLGLPVLTERLRFTSSFITEAEKLSQYQACGVVPLLTIKSSTSLLTLTSDGSAESAHLIESFRTIRCALPINAGEDNKLQVIMVTSSRPNDGKTTVASLLGKSFAEAGDKTLIIDADLRRGSLHRIFSLDRDRAGLGNVLMSDVKWESIVHKSELVNLDVISRGSTGSVSCDSLAGQKMSDLIHSMRLVYDRVIIDTPPLLGIADAQMIRKHVDGLLFVIRSDHTTQRDIATASEILHQNDLPVYGFVLNGVDFNRIENTYYYGSYYSKYYEPTYYSDRNNRLA